MLKVLDILFSETFLMCYLGRSSCSYFCIVCCAPGVYVTATTAVEVVLAIFTASLVVCSNVPLGLGIVRTTVGLANSETM